MATKRFCDIDGAEITERDYTYTLDLSISIRPDSSYRNTEPQISRSIGGGGNYTPLTTSITDVCESCARRIAVVVKNTREGAKNQPVAE